MSILKKSMLFVLLAVIILVCLPGFSQTASAEQYAEGVWLYTVTNGEATITDYAGQLTEMTELDVPSQLGGYPVTTIGMGAFRYLYRLNKVTIPEGVISIQEKAFEHCTNLVEVNIPASVTFVDKKAFFGCSGLENIHVAEGNSVYSSVEGVLLTRDGTEIVQYPCNKKGNPYSIPEGVAAIDKGVFKDCGQLLAVNIPVSVTFIEEEAFVNCARLENIHVAEGNSVYSSVDGVLLNRDGTELIQYPRNKKGNSYAVPDGVTTIGKQAFMYSPLMESLTFPNSLTTIGEYAFYDSKIYNLSIPDSVTEIGEYAFFSCDFIETISIGKGLATIKSYSFSNLPQLRDLVLGENVTTIEKFAFNECPKLRDVTISRSVGKIEENAFGDCGSIGSLRIYDSPKTIDKLAFSGSSIANVYCIGEDFDRSKIGLDESYSVFFNAKWHESDFVYKTSNGEATVVGYDGTGGKVVIPEKLGGFPVTIIGYCAFEKNKTVTSVVIPDSVHAIGESAFDSCSSLASVTLGKGVRTIGEYSFDLCTSLKDVYYNGTRADKKLIMGHSEEALLNAKWHYKGETTTTTTTKSTTTATTKNTTTVMPTSTSGTTQPSTVVSSQTTSNNSTGNNQTSSAVSEDVQTTDNNSDWSAVLWILIAAVLAAGVGVGIFAIVAIKKKKK